MVLKALAAAATLAAITLPSACSQQQPTVTTVVAAVQAACQFTPTAQSIETILNADSTVTQIQDIVNVICSAVQPAPGATAHKPTAPQVVTRNVYINGKVYVVTGTVGA